MKNIFAPLGFLFVLLISNPTNAQITENVSFTQKDKSYDAFSFSTSFCQTQVFDNQWKEYIKTQNGVVKGGIIAPITGENLSYGNGLYWNARMMYTTNEDKSIVLMVSIYNAEGQFLVDLASDEKQQAIKSLEIFQENLKKACIKNEIDLAENYLIQIQREVLNNQEKIKTTKIRLDKNQKKIAQNTTTPKNKWVNLSGLTLKRIDQDQAILTELEARNEVLSTEILEQENVIQNLKKNLKEMQDSAKN